LEKYLQVHQNARSDDDDADVIVIAGSDGKVEPTSKKTQETKDDSVKPTTKPTGGVTPSVTGNITPTVTPTPTKSA
jgi:hypothetical protein